MLVSDSWFELQESLDNNQKYCRSGHITNYNYQNSVALDTKIATHCLNEIKKKSRNKQQTG